MEKLDIPLILGASRPNRYSKKVADMIFNLLKEHPDVETQFVDVKNFTVDFDEDTSIPEFHKIVQAADAFFIVFPEYNRYLPGKLKTLLDTEFDDYKFKPLATASVSNGAFGGVRAYEASIPFFVVLGMIVTGLNVRFPHVDKLFDERGKIIDESYVENSKKAIDKLIYLTKVLKAGKEAQL